jgi:predicted nucleic acid-binding protein
MIVLDTNVLSEPFKSMPSSKCIKWLDDQAAETLYISTVSYAELRTGILRMPDGKRRNDLDARIMEVLGLFKDRTLNFDVAAAEQLAQIVSRMAKIGRKADAPDSYIAATAAAHGFAVATRNVKHFERTGVTVINPWE